MLVTMHHGHNFHQHIRHVADAANTLTSNEIIRQGAVMSPRAAEPMPIAFDGVKDTGDALDTSLQHAAHPFSTGLMGVDQDRNYLLVNVLLISLFALLLITFLLRFWSRYMKHMRHLFTMGKFEDQRYWMMNHTTWWPWIKKNIVYAPLGRQRVNRDYSLFNRISLGTLPTRYHTILLVLYVASNIAYCLVLDYSHDKYKILAELRGRSGIISCFNMIPTVMFALRNNPLIPILGVSYDTFNLLHRWIARICIIQALLHTLCWAINTMAAGGQEQIQLSLSTSTSFTWGLVATCAFGTIFVAAAGAVRHAFYETFLNVHRLLVLFALVGVYVHLDAANLPMKPYVQWCFIMWGAEFAWRWARVLYYNVSRKKGITKVTVEALPAEACRVTFELSRTWRWSPGCHVHMYLPAMALWSSHPFSVAWAENRSREAPKELEMEVKHTGMPEFDSQSAMENLAKRGSRPPFVTQKSTFSKQSGLPGSIATVTEVTHRAAGPNIALPQESSVTHISLVCRARAGLTRHIYDKARNSPNNMFTTWGAIEGPYGGHESLASYGTVILFAGGVGITHQVGYVSSLQWQEVAKHQEIFRCLMTLSLSPSTLEIFADLITL